MIYCVEDDSSIRELMVYTLQASGFEAWLPGLKLAAFRMRLPFGI